MSTDDILNFMTQITEGRKPQTKRIRFSHLTAFFNFLKNNFDCNLNNPCDSPMLRKLFRPKAIVHWDIIEKETVDEIIFRTDNLRNRLMLELMARGGMRVGEVLKLTPNDILDQKLILNDTKSGEEQELILLDLDEVEQAVAEGSIKVITWVTCVALALLHLKSKNLPEK